MQISVDHNACKVSYRKRIAREHSGHKIFLARAGVVVDPTKIFLSSSLITVQNLVAVAHTVCSYVGGPKKLWELWGRSPWDGGMADNTPLFHVLQCHSFIAIRQILQSRKFIMRMRATGR